MRCGHRDWRYLDESPVSMDAWRRPFGVDINREISLSLSSVKKLKFNSGCVK